MIKIKDFFLKLLQNKSSYFILIHNIVPILGVIIFDWEPLSIIAIYIAETIIIGLFNVVKILISQVPEEDGQNSGGASFLFGKFFMAGFFLVHYNAFNYGQVSIMFDSVDNFLKPFLEDPYYVALIPIVITHLFTLIDEFIIGGKYKQTSPIILVFLPYPRIFLQQFVVIFGMGFLMMLGLPIIVLIFFQILKTIFELVSHLYLEQLKIFEKIDQQQKGNI